VVVEAWGAGRVGWGRGVGYQPGQHGEPACRLCCPAQGLGVGQLTCEGWGWASMCGSLMESLCLCLPSRPATRLPGRLRA